MITDISIAGRKIGLACPPFIIAEMSGNHNHSLERALEIVDIAAQAGAHALKLQTYTADTMTMDVSGNEFTINDPNSLWNGMSLYKLYEQAATPWDWHKTIFDRCKEKGLIYFSTPFDESAVEYLESLEVPCYKIASFENTHLPLIRKVASTGKPMIISTGMATKDELDEAVQAARDSGCKDIVLLKCTSTYPSSPADTNIMTIPDMRKRYGIQVGLSDHTLGIGVAVASVALGATVIEKHFTIRRADGGVDAAFSLEPAELKALSEEAHRAWLSLGKISYGPTDKERSSLQFRRSLYIARDVVAGERLTPDTVKIIRPGLGLAPKYYDAIIGKKVKRTVRKGTPITWDMIS